MKTRLVETWGAHTCEYAFPGEEHVHTPTEIPTQYSGGVVHIEPQLFLTVNSFTLPIIFLVYWWVLVAIRRPNFIIPIGNLYDRGKRAVERKAHVAHHEPGRGSDPNSSLIINDIF